MLPYNTRHPSQSIGFPLITALGSRMEPLHFPLYHLFHIDFRLLYCLHSPLPTWTTCYAIYLPMWTPPLTPCTVTATASPTVAPSHYSSSSGWPRIYRITVLQLWDEYLVHYIFRSMREQSSNWVSRWK
jgi:hypothetical protein